MVALSLNVQAAFVQGAPDAVLVVLAAEVAGDFPGDVGREGVVEDAAGVLGVVGADGAVLVETHVVEEDGDDVGLAGGERRQGQCLVVVLCIGVARPGPEEGAVEPDRHAVGLAALGGEGDGGLIARCHEMPSEEQRSSVEAVVGTVQGNWCQKRRADGVRGVGVVGVGPGGVIVAKLNLGERIDVVPLLGREIGNIKCGRRICFVCRPRPLSICGECQGLVVNLKRGNS